LPSPDLKDNPDGDRDRPHYISSFFHVEGRGPVQRLLIVSADGTQVATYDADSGKSTPLKLPAVKGIRREVLALDTSPRQRTLPGMRDIPATIDLSQGTLFFALDLDRANNVTRIVAFDIADGTWIDSEVSEPVDRSSVKLFPSHWVLALGRHVYAVSLKAKRWAKLELLPGTEPRPFWLSSAEMIDNGGRLFRFDREAGTWDDIYARSINGAEKPGGFDTRFAPTR
jgi:hypothetical protein